MGTNGVMTELVFRAETPPRPALVVRVNFGVFAGRNATQSEIDDLAHELAQEVDEFAILAEERHEFGGAREASLRQVVIEIAEETDGLEGRVLAIADAWARTAIRARSETGELGSEL
ncbi:MAG: hypothetical protein ABUS54_09460 [Actinomycetota bacterium]